MFDATQLTLDDDTRRIDSPHYPPTVALATAWHRYRWANGQGSGSSVEELPRITPALRLTQRGRIVRDMVAGTAVLSVPIFATQISVALFTALDWAVQLGVSA